jgi:hypothetical protein
MASAMVIVTSINNLQSVFILFDERHIGVVFFLILGIG